MQCQFQCNRFEIAGQFQKERSERGVEVDEDEYLTPKNDNVANVDIKDEDRNAEASTRLDRDLELDIDFPNPAMNEIGSQFDPEDGTEWTFKDGRKDKEENLKLKAEEEKSTTATIKKSMTEFGGPFQIQLPSLPTVRSLNSAWTVLNNLNVLIYECELQSILFLFLFIFHLLSVIDVDLIRAVVDLFYDGFRAKELLDRENPASSGKEKEEEKIRNLSTYVIGGLLDKQVIHSFDTTSNIF